MIDALTTDPKIMVIMSRSLLKWNVDRRQSVWWLGRASTLHDVVKGKEFQIKHHFFSVWLPFITVTYLLRTAFFFFLNRANIMKQICTSPKNCKTRCLDEKFTPLTGSTTSTCKNNTRTRNKIKETLYVFPCWLAYYIVCTNVYVSLHFRLYAMLVAAWWLNCKFGEWQMTK